MIKYVQIFGERCSGTNYLEQVISKNFSVDIIWDFGWKHFFTQSTIEHGKSIYKDTSVVLFVCIVRSCKDWINSLIRQPHHLPADLVSQGKENFLTHPFYSVKSQYIDGKKIENEIMNDRNIFTGERYMNIFEMRYTKYMFLKKVLPTIVENTLFIRYKDMVTCFEREMKRMCDSGMQPRAGVAFPQNIYFYKSRKELLFNSVPKASEVVTDTDIEKYQPESYLEFEKELEYM